MARKRFINPKICESDKITKLSFEARYLYLCLPMFMDGQGAIERNENILRSKIFPLEDISKTKVKSMLDELVHFGLLKELAFEGKVVLLDKFFSENQRMWPDEKRLFNLDTYTDFQESSKSVGVELQVDDKEEEEDKEERRKKKEPPFFDSDAAFHRIYFFYPRKEGKKEGFRRLRNIVKTDEDAQHLINAITNYSQHITKNKIEPRFIKHFPTFLSEWDDWLDSQTGTVEVLKL